MNAPSDNFVLPRWMRPWERFWFTPADPTVLGLIRILCGSITFYILLAYSFSLQDFMGENAWFNLDLRLDYVRERPNWMGSLNWGGGVKQAPHPKTPFQEWYLEHYRMTWGAYPPAPYPDEKVPNLQELVVWIDKFRETYGVDVRANGLRPPRDEEEKAYVDRYAAQYRVPPPAYPRNAQEEAEIDAYMQRWYRNDPRMLYSKGTPVTSIWFHVTDPTAMAIVHTLIILSALALTLGFCTRITSALTWFGVLSYIHRNGNILFGVDTMMNITLLYLMIGPSGAAFSVDRLLARWWHRAKPGVVQAWHRFWKRPVPDVADIAPSSWTETPMPSVSANVAIRLLQIHIGIIYLAAGLSKLQGPMWWNDTALWYVVGNYELAPMQYEAYLAFLRFLGSHQLLYTAFMTGGGLFTLAFEIGYLFLVWRPRLRWIFLGSAILLHGGIGLFMGLKTFSLMMLVMNMAFLRKEEALWFLGWIGLISRDTETPPPPAEAPTPRPAATPSEPVPATAITS